MMYICVKKKYDFYLLKPCKCQLKTFNSIFMNFCESSKPAAIAV